MECIIYRHLFYMALTNERRDSKFVTCLTLVKYNKRKYIIDKLI